MSSCPECETPLPAEANFCRNCGSSVSADCSRCGTSVPTEADYCPDCGSAVGGTETTQATGDDSALRLRPQEFARRIGDPELKAGGVLNWLKQKKQVKIEAGNRAFVLENGQIRATIGPGKHTIDSLGQKLSELRRGQDYTTVLVEDGDTTVTLREQIRTVSDYPVTVSTELVVRIDDMEQLFTGLMADRETVTAETFQTLLGDAIRDELQATIGQYEHEDLYGNRELTRQLKADIESECRPTFERSGLQLVELRSFEYDDDRDEIREDRKDVQIRSEREDIKDREAELERRDRERGAEDAVHAESQRVRERTAEQSADHTIESQRVAQKQDLQDKQRRHEHKAERETVEHEEETKTTRKEGEVERRELEHEQDVGEIEDLIDVKSKKDQQKLDRKERRQDLEMRREEREAEVERERLQARDGVDLETLASMEDVDEAVAEIAELEKAADLTPEQLEALGAQDSDELAKARQEAHSAEQAEQRVSDQKAFREEIKEMAEDSMDRMQETSESAMDNVSETGQAAAEDTSDNVIVSDTGNGESGRGGSGAESEPSGADTVVICPECEAEVPSDDDFCTSCGHRV
jgi:flagellar biosynthesis GTPase FlhF/ribosomal protein L40E